MDLWVIFLTGLTTGGLSCLAMQGGLLTSLISNQKEQQIRSSDRRLGFFDQSDWMPVAAFLGGKLAVHMVAGFLLGALGSVITLSLGVRLGFQTLAGLFMIATAMNLLNVHPIFRYVAFQPPHFMNRWIRSTTRSQMLFAPVVLGVMTIFIPCGVTQAMEVLAINSGNPIQGMLIMTAFTLGTIPLFAVLGVGMARISDNWQQSFMQLAAVLLIGLGIYSINGVLVVLDAPVTLQKIKAVTLDQPPANVSGGNGGVTVADGVQRVTLDVLPQGYAPEQFTVKAGTPVELTLRSNGTYSCALWFSFREFGIFEQLEPIDTRTVTFTPEKPGTYVYACSMGMYTGTMTVI